MVIHERPGVYVDYDISTIYSGSSGSSAVGLAADYDGTELTTLTSISQAQSLLSQETVVLNLVRLLFQNGAAQVLLYPVGETTAAGYQAAAEAILAEKQVKFLICDNDYSDMELALEAAVEAAAEEGNYCVAIVSMAAVETTPLIARAKSLACERVVLTAGTATLSWDTTVSDPIYGAAALAGLLAGSDDPALPASGAELAGLSKISQRFTETEIDTLVEGGVTVLENTGTTVYPIRAVTTRVTTDDVEDLTWRELTTVLVVDDVIPGVRDALRRRFLRKKNNETTRKAIESQVAVELESRKTREIIDSYGDISAEISSDDPTICEVTFSFAVAHGISRIVITAHITV